MPEEKSPKNIDVYMMLRHNVLKMLYTLFREYPHAQVEPREIESSCETNTKDLNWNLVYLEKCGYVELAKSSDSHPYVACSVSITAEGIDLIEDEDAFLKRFPVALHPLDSGKRS